MIAVEYDTFEYREGCEIGRAAGEAAEEISRYVNVAQAVADRPAGCICLNGELHVPQNVVADDDIRDELIVAMGNQRDALAGGRGVVVHYVVGHDRVAGIPAMAVKVRRPQQAACGAGPTVEVVV